MTVDRPFGCALDRLAELPTVDVNQLLQFASSPAENVSLFLNLVDLQCVSTLRTRRSSVDQLVAIGIPCTRKLLELASMEEQQ